ncbi:MAG: glycosyltransferase family 8 protein [Sphingobacteriia bacterium]|nr:MAG: glycosyltransferase family 8 protein [Sphingobacteriia bacterium]
MLPQKVYHIVATTDAHYMVLLAALIKSLEYTLEEDALICFHIIEVKLTPQLKKQMEDSVDARRIEIDWVHLSNDLLNKFKLPLDRSSYPQDIYMRLLIPYILDPSIQKVLYLDVDMVVLKSVSSIFETDLGECIIAAVKDQRVTSFGHSWGGIKNYKMLGLSPDLPYFNTGLLLIDIQSWRAFEVTKKVFECISKNKQYANYPDQYGLNVVLAEKWKQLDPRWNYFSCGDDPRPFLVHFVGRKPIFGSYNGNSRYKELFFGYLKNTKWYNLGAVSELERYKQKLSIVFSKLMKITQKLKQVFYDKKSH